MPCCCEISETEAENLNFSHLFYCFVSVTCFISNPLWWCIEAKWSKLCHCPNNHRSNTTAKITNMCTCLVGRNQSIWKTPKHSNFTKKSVGNRTHLVDVSQHCKPLIHLVATTAFLLAYTNWLILYYTVLHLHGQYKGAYAHTHTHLIINSSWVYESPPVVWPQGGSCGSH